MVATLALSLFVLSLLAALWKLFELYQTHFKVGSKSWNTYQLALRDELARFSPRGASAEEVRDFEEKEQRYTRRVALQLEQNLFPDEVERMRARVLEQRQRLETIQTYDALKQAIAEQEP